MKQGGSQFSGFLDQGTTLKGELSFSGAVRVDGVIEGSVSTPDRLIIGSSGKVQANVKAGEIEIHGVLVGEIESVDRVMIHSGGRLEGNVSTARLVIEDGGRFEGTSHTTEAAKPEPVEESKPEEAVEPETVSVDALEPANQSWDDMGRSLNKHWGVARRTLAAVKRRG